MTRFKTIALVLIVGATLTAVVPGAALAAKTSKSPTASATGTRACASAHTALARAACRLSRSGKKTLRRPLLFGTLSTLSATSAVITAPPVSGSTTGASHTATLAKNTVYTARSQAAAIAGIKTGDAVAVYGYYSNGAVARSIVYDTAPFALAGVRLVSGKLASAPTSGAFTLTLASGKSITIQTSSATIYVVKGKRATTAPALAAGQAARALVQEMTNGTYVARIVAI